MRFGSFVLLSLFTSPLVAQAPDVAALAERFTRMTAVTGFERAALDSVQALLPGARRDRAGNVVLARGTGPAMLVVCPFDEVGYVVGGIRDDGWLTLRRVGARAPNAIWDQSHEGQRVTVWGDRGPLSAVIGVRSTHLTRGRSTSDAPFTVDDAILDIGASNGAEVRAAGVELLAPVARLKQLTRYGNGLMAGPNVGRRSACAALVASAGSASPSGRVVVAFAVEQELGQRGLRTLANNAGPFVETLIVDAAGELNAPSARADSALMAQSPGLGRVTRMTLAVRHAGTPVETVALADIETLRNRLASAMARAGGTR